MSTKKKVTKVTTTTTVPPELTPEDRRLAMLGLWAATLTGLQTRLEDDQKAKDLKASFYDVAVSFLRDSGINADTVAEVKDALDDLNEDIARQVQEVIAEDAQDTTPEPPVKTKPSPEVAPLLRAFEPRPPR